MTEFIALFAPFTTDPPAGYRRVHCSKCGAPGYLSPEVPRGVETICMKCYKLPPEVTAMLINPAGNA